MSRLSLERIEQASRIIDPVFRNTPQFASEPLSAACGNGVAVTLKVETVNPIRSFKGRGADYFFLCNPGVRRLVCASAGNFGQGMAYAARSRGAQLTVFASVNANPLKLARMRALGAQVRLQGDDFDAAKAAAREYAAQEQVRFVEDSRDVEFTEGAGSIGVELLTDQRHSFDAVLTPLGNGALTAGVARWVKAHSPQTAMIGVCAAGAPAMERSWRSGTLITLPRIDTIADGIGVRVPVPEALADLRETQVDDIVLVEDTAIVGAMRLIHEHAGLVVEPSGAAAVAALALPRFAGQRVAVVLCGSNLTPEQMCEWLFTAPPAAQTT